MNIAGSCVPLGSTRSTSSAIVIAANRATGFLAIVSKHSVPPGRRHARHLGAHALEVGDVLEHVHAHHRVERVVGVGQRLADADVVADLEPFGRGVLARRPDRLPGRIDAGHARAAPRERLGHEAPGAAEIEHPQALPVDQIVEPAERPSTMRFNVRTQRISSDHHASAAVS